MITKKSVAEKLTQYLRHEITLPSLVDWAERAVQEEDFDEHDVDILMAIVSKIGLADVKTFGLTWEDCETMLEKLGYHITVEVTAH